MWSTITKLPRRDHRVGPFAPFAGIFPGRWVGTVSLLLAPALLLAGELLKAPYHFYFPQQLSAYEQHPVRMAWAYALWTVGLLMMWPPFLVLSRSITRTRPVLGRLAGSLTIVGLLVNAFYEGVNHLAFLLVDVQGVGSATHFIAKTYPGSAWRTC